MCVVLSAIFNIHKCIFLVQFLFEEEKYIESNQYTEITFVIFFILKNLKNYFVDHFQKSLRNFLITFLKIFFEIFLQFVLQLYPSENEISHTIFAPDVENNVLARRYSRKKSLQKKILKSQQQCLARLYKKVYYIISVEKLDTITSLPSTTKRFFFFLVSRQIFVFFPIFLNKKNILDI